MASPKERSESGDEPREYVGQRDMDRFWETFDFEKEPLKQRWYVPLLVLLTVCSIPWYLKAGKIDPIIAGLPLWVWTTLGCSVLIALLTALAMMRFWKERDPDDD